jgi:CRISPR-associated endonuclease/helicase Cas3
VYSYEFNVLREQGVLDDYGTGIWCLTNLDYYDAETGIQFEGKDYFIV